MTVYEVNLEIQDEIYDTYYSWLTEHIAIMIKHEGFIGYNLSTNTEKSANTKSITVWYYLGNLDSLNNYLENHSKEMRDDGIKKFGNKFSANRRIFETQECRGNEEFVNKVSKN